MNRNAHIDNVVYDSGRRKLLGLLLFTLLTGCDLDSSEKNKPLVNPDHGKRVEINGEKFRIIYIGGVRFRFPDNDTFIWASLSGDGIHIHLDWPNIPPGKAPETKYIEWLDGKIHRNNQVEVRVIGKEEPFQIDTSKTVEQRWNLTPDKYIAHDDLTLGLKIYSPKEAATFPSYAFPLTPLEHYPVLLMSGNSIYFDYSPRIQIKIFMMGWDGLGLGTIAPIWKETYLGVVETLNKYREDK
jgi:hypothetical protein